MEAELTEASEINSKNDNSARTEEENVDEAITAEANSSNRTEINIKKEHNKKSYKKTMKIYIENIKTFENRDKVYKTQRRTIYKAIEEYYFKKYNISR